MLSNTRNASRVRNSSATRIAGFIIGRMIWVSRCHGPAPSTWAALSRSSGTRARPASSSSAMNGVVFQISARMMMASALARSVSGAPSGENRFARYPVPGVQA